MNSSTPAYTHYNSSTGTTYGTPSYAKQWSEYTIELTDVASGKVIWSARFITDTLEYKMKDRNYTKAANLILDEMTENKLLQASDETR